MIRNKYLICCMILLGFLLLGVSALASEYIIDKEPAACTDSDGNCDYTNINTDNGDYEDIDLKTYPFGWINATNLDDDIPAGSTINNATIHVKWYTDVGRGAGNIYIGYHNGSEWVDCAGPFGETGAEVDTTCDVTSLSVSNLNNIKVRLRGNDTDGFLPAFAHVDYINVSVNCSLVDARVPIACTDSDGNCDYTNINTDNGDYEDIDLKTYPFGWINATDWDEDIPVGNTVENATIHVKWYTDVGRGAGNIYIGYHNGSEWVDCAGPFGETGAEVDTTCDVTSLSVSNLNNIKVRLRGNDTDGFLPAFAHIDYIYMDLNYSADEAPEALFGTSPVDKHNASQPVTFDLACSDNNGVDTLELWGNWTNGWHANQTNSTPGNNVFWNVTVNGIPEGLWEWGVWCNDSAGNSDWSDYNRTLTVDLTAPTDIVAVKPALANGSITGNDYIEVNVTFSEARPDTCLLELRNGSVGNYTMAMTITGSDSGFCFFNATNQSDGDWNYSIWINDTAGNSAWNGTWFITVDAVYILVELAEPVDPTYVVQNTTFTVNATVTCVGGFCGNISGRARYNESAQTPDTDISTSEDTPFYIMNSGTNPANCTQNPLSEGEWCNITWTVNATGVIGTFYKIGVMFGSNESAVLQNHTSNNTVKIVSCLVDMTLQWESISFGELEPGEVGVAEGNAGMTYNTTIEPTTTCDVSLYIRATNFTHNESNYKIWAENVSYNNVSNDYSSGFNMTQGWNILRTSVQPNTNATTYFWLNTPWGIHFGPYTGNLTILAVEEGVVP